MSNGGKAQNVPSPPDGTQCRMRGVAPYFFDQDSLSTKLLVRDQK
jgi:hypothetical protein